MGLLGEPSEQSDSGVSLNVWTETATGVSPWKKPCSKVKDKTRAVCGKVGRPAIHGGAGRPTSESVFRNHSRPHFSATRHSVCPFPIQDFSRPQRGRVALGCYWLQEVRQCSGTVLHCLWR